MTDVGYARVSTRVQNLDLQLDALQRAGCTTVYRDKASGIRDDRPQLTQALETVKPGDTLTVWRLDRLARSIRHLVEIVGGLQERGVRFRSLNESIDTTGATGRLLFHIMAALAAFERELMIERVNAGLEASRARGRVGGPAPFGIAADKTTIVEGEAQLLREAAKRILDHQTLSSVVDGWNDRGIPARKGGRWTVTSLRTMLSNPRTAPILGTDVHDAVERLLRAPDRQSQGAPAKYLLSAILACGVCEQPLYAKHVTQAGRWQYVCRKGAGSGGRFRGCGRIFVSLPKADDAVRDLFLAACCGEGSRLPAYVAEQAHALAQGGPTPGELAEQAAELAELQMILATRFATAEHRARAVQLEQAAAEAELRMRQAPDLAALASLPRTETALRRRWDAWTIAERRLWLKRVFLRIRVKPAPPGTHHRGSDVAGRLDPDWRI